MSVIRICNNHSERLMFKMNNTVANYCPLCGKQFISLSDSMTNFSNYTGTLFETIECYNKIHPYNSKIKKKKESINMSNFKQSNDFIFNYHMLSDNTKNLVIDDIPTMSGVNKIVINGKNLAVYSSVDSIEIFFGKSIKDITVDDVFDYAFYGLVDILYDSLAENKITASDIQFDGIDLNDTVTEAHKIEENVNINGQNFKFFSGKYDFESFREFNSFGAYRLYLDEKLQDEILFDDNNLEKYDLGISKFQEDIIGAVNQSLAELAINSKYKLDTERQRYSFVPELDLDDTTEEKLMHLIISKLKSKYKNFEKLFATFCDAFGITFYSNCSFVENFSGVLDFFGFRPIKMVGQPKNLNSSAKYIFEDRLTTNRITADKKAFFDFLAKDGEGDYWSNNNKYLVEKLYYEICAKTLNKTVNTEYFKGKYSDFIEPEDIESSLEYIRRNGNTLALETDVRPIYFVLQASVTDAVLERLKNKEFKVSDIRALFKTFVDELVKN